MTTEDSDIDVRALTRWLGPEGARAGIEKSKSCTIEVLRRLAEKLGAPSAPKSASRRQLIESIVRIANRRIERPLAELLQLKEAELVDYFERVGAGREELLDLLKEIDAVPTKESLSGLVRFAARELSETGRYIRISESGTGGRDKDERETK